MRNISVKLVFMKNPKISRFFLKGTYSGGVFKKLTIIHLFGGATTPESLNINVGRV